MGKLPRVPIPGRVISPYRPFQPGGHTVGKVGSTSLMWMSFNGSSSDANYDVTAAANVIHNVNGNYSYAMLIRAATTDGNDGRIMQISSSADTGPFLRIEDRCSDKPKYRLRRANFTFAADQDMVEKGGNNAIHLIMWTTRDEGTNAGLRSQVDGNATKFYGAGTEGRQAQGANWPPDRCRLGDGSFDGEIGWFGVAALDSESPGVVADILAGTGGADMWTAYLTGGRRALGAALEAAAGNVPIISQVLDGVTGPARGASPILTDITFVTVEV